MLKIPYYPGCTLNTVAKGFDSSARESALAMGFEMDELRQWNCCGATFPITPDNIIALAAPAKVLSNAKTAGDSLTTLCSVCYNVLKRTNKVMRDDRDKRSAVNSFMDDGYDGSVKVTHFLEVMRDTIGFEKIKGMVKRPLNGIRAAAYYGCMLLRPFEDMGIDNAEAPTVMEDMLRTLGAEPVFFPNRIECCGAHLAMGNKDIVERLSGNVLASASGSGAELIVTTCPLCQYNLEESQPKASIGAPGYKDVPVVYFTQVLGLALGQDMERLGFEKNKMDAVELFRKKGVL